MDLKEIQNRPTKEEIREISEDLGLSLAEEELPIYTTAVQAATEAMKHVADWPDSDVTDIAGRDLGRAPTADENSHNQWVWRCHVTGNGGKGVLAGKRVGVKDCVTVAGLPMDSGNKGLQGFIPQMDAPVVSKILEEGGMILGKTTCENLCYSPLSHTSCHGAVRNPHDPTRTSGGSSCGSAAAVILNDVDVAIGTDTGGSVRMPSALCGCVGIKPTYNLVSTVGVSACIFGCDHVGSIARNVKDCSLLLEAIAGPDNLLHPVRKEDLIKTKYSEGLQINPNGLKIGIVKEGFHTGVEEDAVNKVVYNMIKQLEKKGIAFEEISVPGHKTGGDVLGAAANSEYVFGVDSRAMPYAGRYYTMPDLVNNFKDPINNQNDYGKVHHIWNAFYNKQFPGNNLMAKSVNRMALVRRAYEKAFEAYDAVVMPTVPVIAPKINTETLAPWGKITPNTCPFNSSGHPSITVNCGFVRAEPDKDAGPWMPVGIQFSGGFYQESLLFGLAQLVEDLAPAKPSE